MASFIKLSSLVINSAKISNIQILEKLLLSLNNTINLDEEVLIVCTDPKENKMVYYINNIPLEKYNFKIKCDVTPYAGYDSGAYIYVYQKYKREYYIFLQDSISVKDPNWLNIFKKEREEKKVTAWIKIKMMWSRRGDQEKDVRSKFPPSIKMSSHLIFGPIFQCHISFLDEVDKKYNINHFIPSDKINGQSGMERGWAILCEDLNFQLVSLEDEIWDFAKKKLFLKEFPNRY